MCAVVRTIRVRSRSLCNRGASQALWPTTDTRTGPMNNIVYIVGFIVIVLIILSFLGLR